MARLVCGAPGPGRRRHRYRLRQRRPHARRPARCRRRIYGFDYDLRHLAVAAHTARARRIANAHFFAWDVTGCFPFGDATVDAALFLDVIEHLHQRVAVLREIDCVLRPGGLLLVSGPNRDSSWRRRSLLAAGLFAYSDPDHEIEYTRDEFEAELAAGGFTPAGPAMPVVYDSPWAGAMDALDGLSLALYARLRWKREAALCHPEESTGFQVVARRRP